MPIVNRSTTSTEYIGNATSGIYKSKANEIHEKKLLNKSCLSCLFYFSWGTASASYHTGFENQNISLKRYFSR